MKVLVLGSAGQIGTRATKYLSEQGHDVLTYDIATDPAQDLRTVITKGWHGGDYTFYNLVKDADYVLFLAFDVGGSTYLKKYEMTFDFIQNNVAIMIGTFAVLKEIGTPFIFASSQMSNMSHSSYGVLKALGEKYTHVLGGKVVKFWNVYDLETDPEKFHVITDFIISARDHGEINCSTDGNEMRQFLHAEDASRALEIIMQKWDEIEENDLHITSFVWNSIRDVSDLINATYPCDRKYSGEFDPVQMDAKNEPNTTISKYWVPTITLADGIKRVILEMDNG